LFVNAIKLSVVQTAVAYFTCILFDIVSKQLLHLVLKVGQVSESSECKAKPRRTH